MQRTLHPAEFYRATPSFPNAKSRVGRALPDTSIAVQVGVHDTPNAFDAYPLAILPCHLLLPQGQEFLQLARRKPPRRSPQRFREIFDDMSSLGAGVVLDLLAAAKT